ncbi:hypothetical protein PLEOSDRAFT_1037639 [Pleurotus ostreatus PC15]|uniref:37S ribosomal protein S35, mitochondrial n=1 Tax=Pleurotus ostreatus (strain PC15) TaxID=1137138 RepID=A0A067P5W0_PLEO1|nr:hypothetical protein PLEOSDRAFT_1037639 [Pleurotus ostreatus PC15]
MFSHFRVVPRVARRYALPCHRPPLPTCSRLRYYSDLSPDPEPEPVEEGAPLDPDILPAEEEAGPADPRSFQEFLDTVAAPYKEAKPRNWLGGDPFPLNKSFKPPPPISDTQRTRMYDEYMADPIKNSVRELAQRYHLSIKRVDAILRLKGMEDRWLKGKELQTGFQAGMEKILGTKTFAESVVSDIRYDAREADSLEEEENRDAARQRYQRLYWESTPEDGREPIVPASLEHAKKLAKKITKQAERHKSDPEYMPIIHNDKLFVKTKKEVISQRAGSAPIKFLDVGGKFINVDDRLRRVAGAERKAREKERRTLEAAKSLQKENPPHAS